MSKNVIAICYDFDKTLATDDMQAFSFIPNLGLTSEEFWAKTGEFSKATGTESILSYLHCMITQCKKKGIKLTKEYLRNLGKHVKFYDGVTTWFKRLNSFAQEKGITLEHYIISSGNKEIIEGSSISKEFKAIYDILDSKESMHLNEIAKKVKLNIEDVSYKLMMLELDDKIVALPGNNYKKNEIL